MRELFGVAVVLCGLATCMWSQCLTCGLDCCRAVKRDLAKVQLARLCEHLQRYRADKGAMPSDGEGLAALVGTHLKRAHLMDPWGQTFEYTAPTAERPAVLHSSGRPDEGGPIARACEPVAAGSSLIPSVAR